MHCGTVKDKVLFSNCFTISVCHDDAPVRSETRRSSKFLKIFFCIKWYVCTFIG